MKSLCHTIMKIGWIITLTVGFFSPCFGLPEKEEKLVSVHNNFALQCLKVFRSDGNHNVLFSPYSLSVALGMAYTGARGTTQQKMAQALGYTQAGLSDADVQDAFAQQNSRLQAEAARIGLEVANTVALREGFEILTTYDAALNRSFNALAFKLEFANIDHPAEEAINAWVNHTTHEKIPKVLNEPLDSDTKLVMINAIAFKGLWAVEFRRNLTRKGPFYNFGKDQTQVDMMFHRVKTNYVFDESLRATVLEMLYHGGDYSMLIFLPYERAGVEDLKQNLTIAKLDALTPALQNTTIELYLPKFRLDEENNLKSTLSDLGLHEMFGNGDLSGVAGDPQLTVSELLQHAVFKIDEEGGDSVAPTNITDVNGMGIGLPIVKVDHPFLFFIRNRITEEILLSGQVNQL